MRKLLLLSTLLLSLSCKGATENAMPETSGVMMQTFYWDSFDDTQWTVLESQADTLAKYIDAVWLPPSGYANTLSNNMGYLPIYWFDQKSAFGSEEALRSLIKTLKVKGVSTIADVVINHKNGVTNWTDLAEETWNGNTISWTVADICNTDECVKNGYTATGAADTGEDFDGGRDLDHTSANVQKNVKLYLDFLLNDMGYDGFRYDMVKGYAPEYTAMYNESAQPTYSVGEYWDGDVSKVKAWIDGTKVDDVISSAAFDFPLKYYINDAFGNGNWQALNSDYLASNDDYKAYAVTFVDNHDTYRTGTDGSAPLNANIEAANAFILAMPGTPCVFLRHWQMYNASIKKLCLLRNIVGIKNTANITEQVAEDNGYRLKVKGDKGTAMLVFGEVSGTDTDGYQLAMEGENFKYYVTSSLDISELNTVAADETSVTVPSFCTYEKSETCAFFEAPSTWGSTINCWMWDKSYNYTGGTWPGVSCEYLGVADNGNKVYKWSLSDSEKVSASASNTGIIFNDGSSQTNDMEFINGGYYTYTNGLSGTGYTTDGISNVRVAEKKSDSAVYTLSGMRIQKEDFENQKERHGIYIVNGNKYCY